MGKVLLRTFQEISRKILGSQYLSNSWSKSNSHNFERRAWSGLRLVALGLTSYAELEFHKSSSWRVKRS
jgi:hypothetical protein